MQKKPLHILICDDEQTFLDRLEDSCRAILSAQYEIHLWSTTSPQDLLEYRHPFDIVLLDMQFPDCSGVELAQKLLMRNPICQIIFVSGFLSSVSPAYNVPHLAMILKDQLELHLPHFLLRATELAADVSSTSLQITVKKEQVTIPLARIAAIERIGHWTYFHMVNEDSSVSVNDKLRTREKLSDLLERLASPRFCRCHISYAVNLSNVHTLQKHYFEMRIGGGETMYVPISRFYNQTARDAFFVFLSSTGRLSNP